MTRLLLFFLFATQSVLAEETVENQYAVNFSGNFKPELGVVEAAISVNQAEALLIQLDMAANPTRFSDFAGDGEIKLEDKRLIWSVPPGGGTLTYKVIVNHERGLVLDARMTPDWAVLRLDDVFPAARVRSRVGSRSQSTLQLKGPAGWRFESRYGVVSGPVGVETPDRRFDRPTGWLAAGKLGVRRTTIGERKVSVAAPRNQGMRRMDIISFIRWNLPRLVKVFPEFPDRLLIVGARDDMWRGGLSGPESIYLHANRPLISENSTSPLLHELVHLATAESSADMVDWVVEGLSEYYSLNILLRSNGISQQRYDRAIKSQVDWADRDNGRLTSPSSGANTARAVQFFDMIQKELTKSQSGSLDVVVRNLMDSDQADGAALLALVDSQLDEPSKKLHKFLNTYSVVP